MIRNLSPTLLVFGCVLLVLAGYFLSPVSGRDDAASASFYSSSSSEMTRNGRTSSVPAVAFFTQPLSIGGIQSPFATIQSSSTQASIATPNAERMRKQFEQHLRAYRFGALSPEEKIRIKKSLHELKRNPSARALIVETFFSSDDPQLAESLYGLIRDADLKDVGLLEGLIQRDNQRGNRTSTAATQKRIVDLISDLGTKDKVPYSAVIDGYLVQMARNPDLQLRNAAASQRIWYLNQHQPYNLAAQEAYIVDPSPVVREEVYSLIESRIVGQSLSGQAQLAQALNAALRADYLGASVEEKARVSALLQALTGSGASF